MKEIVMGIIVGAGLSMLFWIGVDVKHIRDDVHSIKHRDEFSQRDFPCAEDEVLGYGPTFGVNTVGCIQIDDLVDERLP